MKWPADFFLEPGPDDQLLTEAENVLTTEEGLHMVVERLVDDERTRAASSAFFAEYLHLDRLDGKKNRDVFPQMTDDRRSDAR